MKVYDYIVVFKRRNDRLTDSISQLMLLLAVCVFIFSVSVSTGNTNAVVLVVLTIGIIGWWIYAYLKQKKGGMPFYRLALLLAAVGWFLQPKGLVIAIIYFIAAALEKQAKFPQEVAFDEEEIVFNTLPKKRYSWQDLTNVVLKDGILTVDFRNNKLIQKEIESQTSAKEEQEFNEFCRARLRTLNAER